MSSLSELAGMASDGSTSGALRDQTAYRKYVIDAQSSGEDVLPMKDWRRMNAEKNKITSKLSLLSQGT